MEVENEDLRLAKARSRQTMQTTAGNPLPPQPKMLQPQKQGGTSLTGHQHGGQVEGGVR
jgi:hypothetical protein